MNKLLTAALTVALLCPAARAAEYKTALEATLYVSGESSKSALNLQDCADADTVEFLFQWSVPSNVTLVCPDTEKADVFLSTAQDCASVSVEIDDVEATGDAQIEIGQSTGEYPEGTDELFLVDITGLDCAGSAETEYYFCLRWDCVITEYLTENTYAYYAAAPLRFDVKPPAALELSAVTAGEGNLKVTWNAPDEDDIGSFQIEVREEGAAEWTAHSQPDEGATSDTVTGLTNGTTYEVRAAAVDTSGNMGDYSEIFTGTPQPIEDGWEHYKSSGGTEPGGFCFVATAAYGSYDAELVLPLRQLRDEVLATTPTGQALVSGYYQFAPRWARAIQGSPLHRGVARAALLPAVGVALARGLGPAEWTLLGLGLLLAGWLVLRARRWLGRLARRAAAPLLALATLGAALAAPAPARAAEPVAQLQLRFGPYYPDVDNQGGLEGQPFKEIYGGGSEFLFEIDVDWEFWRPFGAFTLGGSAGFVQFLGKGLTADGQTSTDTTVFNIIPLKLSLGYHFDVLSEKWSIPLVPYVYGGLCYYIWWVLDGVGDVAEWSDPAGGSSREAMGGLWGLHWGIGLKVLLDFIDESAAANLETEVGIVNTFLFAEYTMSWASNFGTDGHFDVGGDTFMAGLMMEF
ncbi:MAG TPA: fibronectin type III domain-containing protein [Myxococcota bacterium]|nr:fibronectin type III domain-containing protein [Myxococcota bacterium]HRY95352.1 fibronectin type III domain-containing protein [Myxococcota bacterium]HSA21195.1 fibronectin type III domain-containing protein [Myxococcota bacterium]